MPNGSQAVYLRYRDGRIDRGFFGALEGGVARVRIVRSPGVEIDAALPLSIIECIHFVEDSNQPPMASSAHARTLPSEGKSVEVHLSKWSVRGLRVRSSEHGFVLVPSDPRCNSASLFIPKDAPSLIETGDLPHMPDPEEADSELRASSLMSPSTPAPVTSMRESEPLVPPSFAGFFEEEVEPSETPATPLSAFDLRDRPGEFAGFTPPRMGPDAKLPSFPDPSQRSKPMVKPPPPPPPSLDPFSGQLASSPPRHHRDPADELDDILQFDPPVEVTPEELLRSSAPSSFDEPSTGTPTPPRRPSPPPTAPAFFSSSAGLPPPVLQSRSMDLPPLPALTPIMPPGIEPLPSHEVAALIGLGRVGLRADRPLRNPLDRWADPWRAGISSRPVSAAPEDLLPFPTLDLPKVQTNDLPPATSLPPVPSARSVEETSSSGAMLSVPPGASASFDDDLKAYLDRDS